jgi:hypothetical protein
MKIIGFVVGFPAKCNRILTRAVAELHIDVDAEHCLPE